MFDLVRVAIAGAGIGGLSSSSSSPTDPLDVRREQTPDDREAIADDEATLAELLAEAEGLEAEGAEAEGPR